MRRIGRAAAKKISGPPLVPVLRHDVVPGIPGGGPTASDTLRRLILECGHTDIRTMSAPIPKRVRCSKCATTERSS